MNEKEIQCGKNIDETVNLLVDCEVKGYHAFCDFNGHILHSDGITVDKAYQEITGMTKQEFVRERLQMIEDHQKLMEEKDVIAKQRIPEWLERGKAVIYPERYEDWEKYVNKYATGYMGMMIDNVLEIMEASEKGANMEELAEIKKKQGHSGWSQGVLQDSVFFFCKKGPEYVEANSWFPLKEEDKVKIEAKKEENRKLADLHTEQTKKL